MTGPCIRLISVIQVFLSYKKAIDSEDAYGKDHSCNEEIGLKVLEVC